MSRAIFYNFKNILKNTNTNNSLPIEYKINILGIILGANFCYATTTKEEAQINIQKKYKFDRNKITGYSTFDGFYFYSLNYYIY